VIGASAGGVDALQKLVGGLPADLPATVFIVLHVGPTSHLAAILDRVAPINVVNATSGADVVPGRVYVAPPGFHLLLHNGHMMLRRGPRENLSRPSIDPLFRSAACSFGARVIGVILTGSLSDGTAGLRAVKDCGGLAVVQHPEDAAVPDMVLSAVRHVDIDHCVPLSEMPDLLARLAAEEAGETPEIPSRIRLEAAVAAQEHGNMKTEDRLGDSSVFVCPECHGPLWEIEDGPMLRYRCHTGHAFTADVMMEAQSQEAEQILWSLLRAHQQRAELARRLSVKEKAQRRNELAAQFAERAKEYAADAALVEQIIESRQFALGRTPRLTATAGGNTN
jgi:two-component system, chemotaxis family, protein-glutamate methylesterase/glutaminase